MRAVVVAALALALAGCSAVPSPHPPENDYDVILRERVDAVWAQTDLPAGARPAVVIGPVASQFDASLDFSQCMADRGWPDYYVNENGTGFGYRSIDLATTDAEAIDWYECFAAHPVDARYTMDSVEQFDFVYDYFQDQLIPCLAEHGYDIARAPTRLEFRTIFEGWTDPLFPFVWNPYFDLTIVGYEGRTPIEELCPPAPPNQVFYEAP